MTKKTDDTTIATDPNAFARKTGEVLAARAMREQARYRENVDQHEIATALANELAELRATWPSAFVRTLQEFAHHPSTSEDMRARLLDLAEDWRVALGLPFVGGAQ